MNAVVNRRLAKKQVQYLTETLYRALSSLLPVSFRFRNRRLLLAQKHN
jgi:hypothetical protein